ncbi:hypothetical protein [Paraburkholderia sp. DHOC27]|uniref:hypothetical protein n=1 Tax=Paraburkholderia sp. DHOC27 TaxID=2303330 RepID=UPI000E3C86A4|nr:hypothetical protein [Paraburkholderia sp. DHOC27]RFU45164.1 hypothetical protein D0B32_25860 [Paraburkholderia sp. DHOC27]
MKIIPQLVVAAVLAVGLVRCASAHVSIGVGIGFPVVAAPAYPVMPALPVYAPPPPVYYAPPPPPVYTAPVVGYYGPPVYPRYYGGYGYGYWRR